MAARKLEKRLAERILQGLEEGLAFCRGEKALKTTVFLDQLPASTPAGVVQLREQLRVSRQVFAQMLNVSPRTVQDRERSLRAPTQSSLRLLHVIQQRPEVIAEVAGSPDSELVHQKSKSARPKSRPHASRTELTSKGSR